MNFIEVTEEGEKYFINANKILSIQKQIVTVGRDTHIDSKGKQSTRFIKAEGTCIVMQSIIDGTFRKEFHVEEKYEDVKNLIYRS